MKINLRTKIRYNGREYSSPSQLPPDVRAAYRKASASHGIALNRVLDKIVVTGRFFADYRRDPQWFYEDIMSVVESNGEVTLPVTPARFLTRGRIATALVLLGTLAAAAVAVLAKGS